MEIEISDENDIGIVSVDDLMDNEVLVVKERILMDTNVKTVLWRGHAGGKQHGDMPTDPFHRSHDQALPSHVTVSISNGPGVRSRGGGNGDSTPYVMVGVPQLSHFIQCNSFGYYFLAEAENVKLVQAQSKTKRAHCIVKVPHIQGELFTERERERR